MDVITRKRMSNDELVAEFEWTRPRHGGDITVAAGIFGMTAEGIERALYRARKRGIDVQFSRGPSW